MAWEKLVSADATVYDTVRLIIKTVNAYSVSPFVQEVTAHISKTHPTNFLKGVFDFVCNNVSYERDPIGHEKVYTPQRTFRERRGDCKKMSTFISAILKCKGIENYLRIVSYDGESFAHIYTVVPCKGGYITLDPVNDKRYNSEVSHTKSETYNLSGKKMKLSILGRTQNGNSAGNFNFSSAVAGLDNEIAAVGCPCRTPNNYNADAMGGQNNYFSFTNAEKIGHIAKAPLLAIPRNAFLGLLYLGKLLRNTPLKLNFADRLARAWNKNKNGVRKMWWKLGGTADADSLKKAIMKGTGMSLSGPVGKGYDHPIDLVTEWKIQQRNGMNGLAGPQLVAALAAAAPIVQQVVSWLKSQGINVDPEPPVPEDTPPPADPPPADDGSGGGGGGVAQGASGFMFAFIISDQLPIYISIPILAFVVWHFNKEKIKNFFHA